MSQAGLLCFPPAEDDQGMVVDIEGPANEDDLQCFWEIFSDTSPRGITYRMKLMQMGKVVHKSFQ